MNGLIACIVFGITLLVCVRLARSGRPGALDQVLLAMQIGGLVIVTFASLGGLAILAGPLGVGLWLVLVVAMVITLVQLHVMRQRSLSALVALAVEKRMPLGPLLQAYAADQPDSIHRGASNLAEQIAAGVPLGEALWQSRGAIGYSTAVAARLGQRIGTMPALLSEAVEAIPQQASLRQALLSRLFWFFGLVVFGTGILSYVMTRIVPAFIRIFEEFKFELPPSFIVLINLSHFLSNGVGAMLLGLLLLVMGSGLILAIVGGPPPWGLGWIGRRLETGHLLRAIAAGAQRGSPIDQTLSALSEVSPRSSLRRRLAAAAAELRAGRPWTDCLAEQGLIRPADGALLAAASRVGNLPWALRQVADSSDRRLNYRLEVLLQAVTPLVVLIMGGVVLVVVVVLFLPLVKLIGSLT